MTNSVSPGSVIELNNEGFECGIGVYERNGKVYSSLIGKIVIEDLANGKKRINVISSTTNHREAVVAVGDCVICKVVRVTYSQAQVEIIQVEDSPLDFHCAGAIRKEDVRSTEIDSVVIRDSFRPGDMVKAVVISLGDSRQYYLSTADEKMGVILAKHHETGEIMVPINLKEMEDMKNSMQESRKVAKS